MSLVVGTRLGPYEIQAAIGAGGMGEVYRARDTRLDRTVAIKVLPAELSADPERRARFAREAKAISQLTHPHICVLHDIGQATVASTDPTVRSPVLVDYLVMEYLEGETLAQHLAHVAARTPHSSPPTPPLSTPSGPPTPSLVHPAAPLPLDQTLRIGTELAEALAAAHKAGIIHRDLKPGNVMLTAAGVKVLDFGLAKLHAEASASAATSMATCTAEPLTDAGTRLGTVPYMSPEQVEGKEADARSDVFALGAILYEMATGHRAFEGETAASVAAAILDREPPPTTTLQPLTPPALEHVVSTCLAKDPEARWQAASDVARELRWVSDEIRLGRTPTGGAVSAAVTGAAVAATRRSRRWRVVRALAALAAAVAIGAGVMWLLLPVPPRAMVTSTIKVEPDHWLDGWRGQTQRPSRAAMAISSDGTFVVYSAIEADPGGQAKSRLFLRSIGQSKAKPIAGTEGAINPFLSPDNRWVGFEAEGRLKKIPVDGGVPTTLCEKPFAYGANWGQDNRIVFAGGASEGLSVISADGGRMETLTTPDPKREESDHHLPFWLPNGQGVLFTVMRHYYDSRPSVALLRLASREWNILLADAADAKYVPTGHLLFLRQSTLMAVRFDLTRLAVIGQPVALVEGVMQAFNANGDYNSGAGQFGISDTGSLVYAAGEMFPDPEHSLVWVDLRGVDQPVTTLRFPYAAPRLSPDGQKVAYVTDGREWQVWVYDLGRGTNARLTSEGVAGSPIWTPDGKRLVFAWQKSLVWNLFWQPSDGSSPIERLTTSPVHQYAGSCFPDGRTVALTEWGRRNNGYDIAILEVPSGRVLPFPNTQYDETDPEFSPDGRWIAYVSNESMRNEVYLRPFPSLGTRSLVSSGGGEAPRWTRNGKELFYRRQNQMWVVNVQSATGFLVSKPRLVFEKPGYAGGGKARHYDLSLDGQRFLMVKLDQRKATPVTEMVLVQNWFEELKAKVPAGGAK
jgi:serine/threonine-protein kinase